VGRRRTFNYQAGDVGYVPFAMAHYVQNLCDEPLRYRVRAALEFKEDPPASWDRALA
jgi:oxalate decarboxylase/phosphoglucose isomerase-like protein (cupin superfamily)